MAEPAPLKRSGTEVLASLEGDEIKVVQVASENQVAALQKALKWCVEQMQGQREENVAKTPVRSGQASAAASSAQGSAAASGAASSAQSGGATPAKSPQKDPIAPYAARM